MVRKFIFLIIAGAFFISTGTVHAQREFWGTVKSQGTTLKDGYIFKVNSTGDNLEIKHKFQEAVTGRLPTGITQASNGKLYGLTSQGGLSSNGTLFEYNLAIDSLRILVSFDTLSFPPYNMLRPDNMGDANVGLTEAIPGILYGQVVNGSAGSVPSVVFSYDIATGTISIVAEVPKPDGGNYIRHAMYKASDGYIYATTHNHSLCAGISYRYNSIISINPVTHALSTLYKNPCSATDGLWCATPFVEQSATEWYGIAEDGGTAGEGVIFTFNPTTNVYTKKYDFTGSALGGSPNVPLIKAANGKIYGTALRGAADPPNVPGGSGIIFEYDPFTNMYQKKLDFRYGSGSYLLVGTDGNLKLKGSNDNLYGATTNGIFEYNVTTNTTRAGGRFPIGVGGTVVDAKPISMIEICRPPAYKYYSVKTYTKCEGESLHLDLQCTNATSIVWKHNNVVDASRTTSVLDFTSITPADTGTWICELTNECGTTIPPSIKLNFNSKPAVVLNNNILQAPVADSYQWVDCQNDYELLENETSQSFTATASGQYAVIVTNGICKDTSACSTVTITSVNELLAQEKLSLYPNPATDRLELQVKGDIRIMSVQIVALTGETVISGVADRIVDVSSLKPGFYFISAQTSQGNWNGKFIKR